MTTPMEPLHILVAGPYRSGTSDDPVKIKANVDAMSRYRSPPVSGWAPASPGRVVRFTAYRARRLAADR